MIELLEHPSAEDGYSVADIDALDDQRGDFDAAKGRRNVELFDLALELAKDVVLHGRGACQPKRDQLSRFYREGSTDGSCGRRGRRVPR